MRVWPGRPYPLGATWDGEGVNFALFSEHATSVELCLFDQPGDAVESTRVLLQERTHHIWHGYLPDARPGQLYGYRVHGPYAPDHGHRFNAAKLLLDPYAKAFNGVTQWNDALLGGQGDADNRDSAPFVPRCVVIEPAFTWGDDRAPHVPWNKTVIYECHVKGLTALHPRVPPNLRGTYSGLASESMISHLQSLGVTAVELLPVHQSISEHALVQRGLTNYWGYNSIGYFAPDVRFASAGSGVQGAVCEFKTMVKSLHRAGIEVILDVVYNHTGEGDHLGPTISLRGIDNASYYRLDPRDLTRYVDYTGCGNSLNMLHPRTLQMILDSLRYWVQEMHVDGFRFDLAPALARELHEVNRLGRFFAIIQQDPVLSQVKLIAEPWDLGAGGYQVGNFPNGWAEWNGQYRDTVRRIWRGDRGQIAQLAYRLSGSSDLYEKDGRRPYASVNFVTCHDGFTLQDWVSYSHKHNEANGEKNRDGADENWSANWGAEGPTSDPKVSALRQRMVRNVWSTLLCSQGVPMLLAGDEIGHTQGGNNNAYCQDNPISWLRWDLSPDQDELLAFVTRVLALRRTNPVLRRRSFFRGRPATGEVIKDLSWVRVDGQEMVDADWHNSDLLQLGMLIHGHATDEVDERGQLIRGDTLLLLINAASEDALFHLPGLQEEGSWRVLIDTQGNGGDDVDRDEAGVRVIAHGLVLLTHGKHVERRRSAALGSLR